MNGDGISHGHSDGCDLDSVLGERHLDDYHRLRALERWCLAMDRRIAELERNQPNLERAESDWRDRWRLIAAAHESQDRAAGQAVDAYLEVVAERSAR